MTVKEFETTLQKTLPAQLPEEAEIPDPPAQWITARDAQLRASRLMRRAAFWCPAMIALILGIALGIAPVPLTTKSAVGAVAGALFGWIFASYKFAVRRADDLLKKK